MNDDKYGNDNNMGKMMTQIKPKIQKFQKFFAKNVCVSWWEIVTKTLK
jgi:hypothetical protein